MATLDAAHEGLVFGRLDMRREVDRGAALHRPDRAARRQPRRAADRLAGARGRGVLPGDARPSRRASIRRRILRSIGRARCSASRTTCSTPRPRPSLPIVGEGALMAQLSRARDRSMHSIVATIQAEQDRAIRAPNKGVVTISGGPGTGKTVVALHRAAFLLYADRRRYETGGVLVVGPVGRVHALHRAGAAVPRRDRGRAALARRGRRRRPRDPARRPGGRRGQGLGGDGRGAPAYGAPGGARRARGVPLLLPRRRAPPRPARARPRSVASCSRWARATARPPGSPRR